MLRVLNNKRAVCVRAHGCLICYCNISFQYILFCAYIILHLAYLHFGDVIIFILFPLCPATSLRSLTDNKNYGKGQAFCLCLPIFGTINHFRQFYF